MTAALTVEAKRTLGEAGGVISDVVVTARDGIELRGWSVVSNRNAIDQPSRNWVLLFHGQGDNRIGMLGFAEFLLRAGYSVLMMDSRAQGDSGGAMATYGSMESDDVRIIIDEFEKRIRVRHLFALGVSMGAAIALLATARDARIEGTIAECPFASLHEASYDFVSGHHGPWLGRTILWPATVAGIYAMEKSGNFDAAEISPVVAVLKRPFPVFLIADGDDRTLPPRHTERIFDSVIGPKQLWIIPVAPHASGLGTQSEEHRRRVLPFLSGIAREKSTM